MKIIKPVSLATGAFIYSLLTLHTALADDTEIYVPKDLPADQQVRPNILFVLDSSGSMGSTVPDTGGKSRNRVMREVVNNLIDQLKAKEDVNVGLMRFRGTSNEQGGRVLSPVQRLTTVNAPTMQAVVDAIPAEDWTPLSETYYEAYRYMAGLSPVWGAASSTPTSMSGGKYISPVSHACQKSHIIYITDGAPTRDVASNSDIRNLVSGKNTLYPSSTCGSGHGQCLPHLAEYMANQDLFPAPTPFSDPTNRKQTVTSHFVGFAVDLPLLKNAADAGGGKYYTSGSVSGLTDALKAITVDITAENSTFAAPSVAVSAFNNLGFRNDLYYALFRPAEGANWPGNVKRYKLAKDSSGNPLIVDKNGNAAIDDSTGFFSESASSFWSSIDGKEVSKGGVAAQLLNPDTRNVLTWTDNDRMPEADQGVTGSQSLASLTDSNNNLTQSMLGASNSAERTTYINWARGKKLDGSPRLAVGDVLHNEPKLVAYTTDEDLLRVTNAQKPTSDPAYQASPEQLYMFFGSNEGAIHAIDPTNGTEKFAFYPKELLGNPGAYFNDAKGSTNKKYGMDGQINLWTEYGPLDAATNTRSISRAYLYAGMRRGGSNYYALDVTNIDTPELKWVIKGPTQTKLPNGSYVNADSGFTPGYSKLGQTFSSPKLAKVKLNGVDTKVLIFTGGYDLDHDNIGTNEPKNDDIGNSLFIANADTGQLIWRAGNVGDATAHLQVANMTNSMPADPTLVDITGDGLIDIIYASDLRGQVFRFDINSANKGAIATGADAFARGGRIASLGGSSADSNRRFFTAPDVALIRERGGKNYFTISLGSGFRESPLNTDTNDRFYVLRDFNVFTQPGSYTSIVEGDLVDVSSVDLTDTQSTQILSDIAALEAKMNDLNQALKNAQDNFTAYKTAIGHTDKQNAAIQASGEANARQKQIDSIMANDPYLAEHAPNTRQQAILQDSLTRARDVLAAVEQARTDAQSKADQTDAAALTIAADDAEAALSDATSAYNSAQASADADAVTASQKQQDKQTADQNLADQDTLIQAKQADRDQKKTDWENAGSPPSPHPLFTAYNDAEAAVQTAQNDRVPLQQAADTANQDYLNAQSAADSSAADAASKQAAKDSATTSRDDAVLARDDALHDDSTAANLKTQRDRMALEYEKLIKLQNSVDTANAQILSKENQILAAKADPNYPSDDIPALEAELATLRQDYADSGAVLKRTELNTGAPTEAVVRLNEVNDALSAGDAAAVAAALQAALDALESSIGLTASPTLSSSELLARDEVSKSAALLEKANNEASTLSVVTSLAAERNAFTTTAKGYQDEADVLADKEYNHGSGLLTNEQYSKALAQAAPAKLTFFQAYEYLIDEALADANDLDTGLPALRIQINDKYAQLTPGNSYTPNMALLDASKGFYLRLPKGEKVLSTSISFRGTVLFSSFSPRGQAVSTCGTDVGRGRTYALNLRDASAVFTETVSGTKTPVRSFDLQRSGIPPTPSVLLGDDGAPTVLTGTEILDPDCVDGAELCRAGDAVKATYWREN